MSVMIDALLSSWDRNLDYARRLMADVPEERMVHQPAPHMNHPAWIFSHMNLYHPAMTAMLTHRPFDDPRGHRFGMQSTAEPDASIYAPRAELLAQYERGHAEVSAALRTAGAAALERDTPLERWRPQMPKLGIALAYLMLVHESTHLGQISMWRRVQGMARV